MSKSKNDNETQNCLGENPLSINRTSSDETTLISEIPNIINQEKLIATSGQGEKIG